MNESLLYSIILQNKYVNQLHNTCRANEEQINRVKKTELSERSEFSVFSGLFALFWESDAPSDSEPL
jgi:hypothetical protein